MSSTDRPLIGHVVDGRYRVDLLIARGGMATVYRAQDLRLERPVALKIMRPVLADDPEFVRRFVREARSAAKLTHPAVVAVFDQGTSDGLVFLVMEFVPGRTLRDVLTERGSLSPGEALGIVARLLDALDAAHAAGIAHRDVKPENVLIREDGTVKVADFGLARAFDADSRTAATAGLLIGTVAYLAPEQVEQGKADPRTDVYSAGIVLFECLTGDTPYSGETPLSVAYQHVHGRVPDPSEQRPGLPRELDALIGRATARDPSDRYQSAAEFAADVRAADGSASISRDGSTATARTVVLDLSESGPAIRSEASVAAHAATSVGADAWTQQPPGPVIDLWPDLGHESGEAFPQGTGPDSNPPAARPPLRATRLRGPWKRRRLWAALALLAVALVTAGAAWLWVSAQFTQVPSLIGLAPDAGASRLHALGLGLDVVGEEFSEDIAKGLIASTDPAPEGRARNGSTVNARVSKGPERHDVPTVRGMTVEEATAALQAATLRVGTVGEAFNDKTAAGKVISAKPEPGTLVKRDAAVDLVVSRGPAPVAMPAVVGKAIAKATKALGTAGLALNRVDEYSETVDTNVVISSKPAPGTLIHRMDTVTLVVSKGPPPVPVPDVTRLGTNEAKARLHASGFRVVVRNQLPVVMFGRVYSQYPAGGTQAPRGSTITISIV